MIQNIKKAISNSSVKTEVEKRESKTFGDFYRITIIDGEKFTFILTKKEIDNLIKQIKEAKNV